MRETNLGAGQGLGKDEQRKGRKQKEGVERAEATRTQDRQKVGSPFVDAAIFLRLPPSPGRPVN